MANPSDSVDPIRVARIQAALKVIFIQLMEDGDTFLAGRLFADGRFYRVKIEIEEIIE